MTKYLKKAEMTEKKTEKPSKSRIFLLKAEELAALESSVLFLFMRNNSSNAYTYLHPFYKQEK